GKMQIEARNARDTQPFHGGKAGTIHNREILVPIRFADHPGGLHIGVGDLFDPHTAPTDSFPEPLAALSLIPRRHHQPALPPPRGPSPPAGRSRSALPWRASSADHEPPPKATKRSYRRRGSLASASLLAPNLAQIVVPYRFGDNLSLSRAILVGGP